MSAGGDGTGRSGLGSAPLLARLEEASMAPHVQFDESRANVAGKQAQVMVLRAPRLAIVRIAPDRTQETIGRLFGMVLRLD